jgi:DNA-binding NarL/FixJ family response regulator
MLVQGTIDMSTHGRDSTSILLVDDEDLVRRGIRLILEGIDGLEVIGEARDGHEAIESVKNLRPKIVVLDVTLPLSAGIDTASLIRQHHPRIGIVVLTGHMDPRHLFEALAAGVFCYVLKSSSVSELKLAIEAASAGQPYITPPMLRYLIDDHLNRWKKGAPLYQLTTRRREILQFIVQGKTNKEIAIAANLSVKTVERHRTLLMQRFGVHNTAELVRFAVENRVVE